MIQLIIIYNSLLIERAMSDPQSPKESSNSQGSASEQFAKNIQNLIDSDDDEVVMKKMLNLHLAFPLLKKMNNQMSNQEKLNMFLRDNNFRVKLTDRLRDNNYFFFDPIIKIHLYTIRHRLTIRQELDYQDVHNICQKFGNVVCLTINRSMAYIRYDNYISCFLAIKTLNHFEVKDILRLSANWCDQNDINALQQLFAAISINTHAENKKFMARYDIFLEYNDEFKLSKRIIGPKGNHMKKILNEAFLKSKMSHLQIESIAKIRLRGKGSGFLEGQYHVESDQILNLCISSKNEHIFMLLCEQIEKLLYKISLQYKDYYYKIHKKLCEGVSYRKYEFKKNEFECVKQINLEQINNMIDFIDPSQKNKAKIKQKQVLKLISQRDKVRKQGKFKDADLIRAHLMKEGIILFDEKHANGHICKTTWKYIDQ